MLHGRKIGALLHMGGEVGFELVEQLPGRAIAGDADEAPASLRADRHGGNGGDFFKVV